VTTSAGDHAPFSARNGPPRREIRDYREIERTIRRQPGDARHIFALATYDEAVRVFLGTAMPLILSADDDPREGETVDPIQLVLPVDLDASQVDEPPETDADLTT